MVMVAMCCNNDDEIENDGSENGVVDARKNPSLWIYLIGHLAGSSYIIGMLELMIKRNKVDHAETAWTFGQLLAMVMLVGPLIELISLLLERMEAREQSRSLVTA